MRIVIITQNDPFYLADNIDYLISNLPDYAEIVGMIVSDVSPFGKRESFIAKSVKTIRVFGAGFFIRYALKFVLNKLNPKKKVFNVIRKHNIDLINLDGSINSQQSIKAIKSVEPDLLISIAGNEIFKKPLIELAPKGCLNLHTALLPKYRGLMPSFWVLKNQENETGVSVFFVDEGIDSGPIFVQKTIAINGMSQEDLISRTKRMGMDAIIEAAEKIYRDDITVTENSDDEMSYYHFPTRKDVEEFLSIGARFY